MQAGNWFLISQKMAAAFKEYLGEFLVTEPLVRDATCYPSPMQLRRRIIIKHRKGDDATAVERARCLWVC